MTAPGVPIKNLPPFVTDTLFPAAGGPIKINRSYGFSPLGPMNSAMTMAPLRPTQGDTGIVFYRDPTDETYAHEIGHLIDHRNLAPDVLAQVAAKRKPYEGQQPQTMDEYFRSNREEYVAQAFAKAMESARHGFADSTSADKDMPGVIDFVRWLRGRQPFKGTK